MEEVNNIMKYTLDKNGIVTHTDEEFNSIPECAFSTNFEDIENGYTCVMSEDQINFYLNHQDYDWKHIFTMTEYSDQEVQANKTKANSEVESIRQGEYKKMADPLYMGYVKNLALGDEEKATEYYNKWLEAVSIIKEQNPYII